MLFRPAIRLMNRLKYPQKFILISLLFTLPLAFVMRQFIDQINISIHSAEMQRDGGAYLRPLRNLSEHVPQSKLLAHAYIEGQVALRPMLDKAQAQIDADFADLEAVERRYGAALQTSEQYGRLQFRWKLIRDSLGKLDISTSDRYHDQLNAYVHEAIIHVGNTSTLILDASLDSYYLMDAVLLKLPESANLISQAAVLGTDSLAWRRFTPEERAQLAKLTTLADANVDTTGEGIETAFRSGAPQIRARLEAPLDSFLVTSHRFLNIVTEQLQKDDAEVQTAAFNTAAREALDANFKLWDSAMAELNDLLQQRIDRLTRQRQVVIALALIALSLVMYLLISFYLSVMRTVSSLAEASQRMVSGSMDGTVSLDSRDELAQVARSFNDVASALIAASAYRQAVVDNAVDGIFTIDTHGAIRSFNPAAGELFGYAASEVIGQNIRLIIAEPYHSQYKLISVGSEVIGRRRDGSSFEMEMSVGTMGVGDERMYIVTARDISARKRVQAEMDMLAHAVRSTRECVSITDMDDRVIFVNEAFLRTYGYTERELIGNSIASIRSPNNPPHVVAGILPATLNGGWQGELLNRRRDGTDFPIFLSTSTIRDQSGHTFALIGVATDITERRRAEEELQRAKEAAEIANQAKSAFLANMSHELRTPLNAIIGYSEMLQEEAADIGQDDFIPDLNKIHVAGKHLLTLINDILDLSKIEAGKMELYIETFDIATMVQEVVTTIEPLARQKSNALHVRLPDALGSMRADLTKVRQALFNLLSNASKFTERGDITLEVTRLSEGGVDWAEFRVADSGIGMNADQLGRLFQPFTQADSSTTRKYGGTGLGLAITRRFCQMMGGDVTVASQVGHGSTFTIRIPVDVPEPADQADALAGPLGDGLPGPGSRALIIDDNPAVCELIERFLSKEGFWVSRAMSGEEGLRLARELRPDVILLDVLMPGMDGWAVLAALKASDDLADIPVVMLTIMADKNMGFALGASDYLTKPINRDRLASVLQKYRRDLQPASVLLVEDDSVTRQMMRRALEKEGWTVCEAENGRVALERVQERRPELILLDLMMPEMDGFEFVAEMRKRAEWRTVPVVVITAKDVTSEDRTRLNGYVERVLQKGAYNRNELLSEIRTLMEQRLRSKPLAE